MILTSMKVRYGNYMTVKILKISSDFCCIDNIIEELDKKREVALTKKQKTLLKDEVLKY